MTSKSKTYVQMEKKATESNKAASQAAEEFGMQDFGILYEVIGKEFASDFNQHLRISGYPYWRSEGQKLVAAELTPYAQRKKHSLLNRLAYLLLVEIGSRKERDARRWSRLSKQGGSQ